MFFRVSSRNRTSVAANLASYEPVFPSGFSNKRGDLEHRRQYYCKASQPCARRTSRTPGHLFEPTGKKSKGRSPKTRLPEFGKALRKRELSVSCRATAPRVR